MNKTILGILLILFSVSCQNKYKFITTKDIYNKKIGIVDFNEIISLDLENGTYKIIDTKKFGDIILALSSTHAKKSVVIYSSDDKKYFNKNMAEGYICDQLAKYLREERILFVEPAVDKWLPHKIEDKLPRERVLIILE